MRGALPQAEALAAQQRLVRRLSETRHYPHAVVRVEVVETHISHVLLTGRFAYKIKKPVNLGFLDFSTLELRRHFCEEELRLNRRLAPALYLEVVAICGSAEDPRMEGEGEPIEYAVKMLQFDQDGLLDRVLARGELSAAQIDALVETIARFHAGAARASETDVYGSPASVCAPMEQNFQQLRARLTIESQRARLEALVAWSEREELRLAPVFEARKREGCVRECHGDLHLGNIALMDGVSQVFDCIEFDPNLRWIDVVSELAFLVMDLSERGRPDYGARVLNDYLEITGDYAGLRVLPCYLVYRALVRAKIFAIRADQDDLQTNEREAALASCRAYLRYAERVAGGRQPALIITHGVAGSGKTHFSQALLESIGAIRLRSDVERKRLHGLAPGTRSGAALGAGIYGEQATDATYAELRRLAALALDACAYPVVVDATFLARRRRDALRDLARERRIPFLILDCRARVPALVERIRRRRAGGRDASEATLQVLEHQIATAQPLRSDEAADVIEVDAEHDTPAEVAWRVRRRLGIDAA